MIRTTLSLALLALFVAAASPAWAQRDARTTNSRTTSKSQTMSRQSASSYAAAEKRKGTGAVDVASRLGSEYRQSSDRMAKTLSDAGFSTPQVMTALLSQELSVSAAIGLVGQSGATGEMVEMAQTLADAGYPAAEVEEVLVGVYGADAGQVAGALRAAGFTIDEIAGTLYKGGSDAWTPAIALRDAGYSCSEVYQGLTALGRRPGFQSKMKGLYDAGCSRDEVEVALKDAYGGNANYLARMLALYTHMRYSQ